MPLSDTISGVASTQKRRTFFFFATLISCSALFPAAAVSQTPASPSPAPSATPVPTPTPMPGSVTWALDGEHIFVDQQTGGPGTQPPEAPAFAAGAPLAPNTPYDLWSSAPQIPGLAGVVQYVATPTYNARHLHVSATLGFGFLTGSVTNAAYWGENLLPTYNPHLGNTALPYAIVFPANADGDRATAFRTSILGASVGAPDGAWNARAGYFDLAQTDRFIFIQPAFTNVTPAIAVAPAESLNNGLPALASWPSPEPGLPLLGIDLCARRGIANAELSSADLPALPGTHARITASSVAIDHGEGTRYTAELTHIVTGGSMLSTTTFFGSNATTYPGPQGDLPVSSIGGQRATIAGASASFHATKAIDATLEIARQWYDADDVIEPGSEKSGGYYHLALMRKIKRVSATVEAFRFEPRYATTILPYGIPENIWSSAWSWPGPWLKSTYEINDNSAIGVNRQGFRVKYNIDGGPLEMHLQLARYAQVDEATYANVHQTGFVDGFFLPQADGFGTRGTQTQYAAWIAWHPHVGTVTLDYVADREYRPAASSRPQDFVDYITPQTVLAFSRMLSPSVIVSAGYGYYGMKGTWATTPLRYGQATYFAGTELQESKQGGVLVELRHNALRGLPSFAGGPSPDFGANLLVVEQRLHF